MVIIISPYNKTCHLAYQAILSSLDSRVTRLPTNLLTYKYLFQTISSPWKTWCLKYDSVENTKSDEETPSNNKKSKVFSTESYFKQHHVLPTKLMPWRKKGWKSEGLHRKTGNFKMEWKYAYREKIYWWKNQLNFPLLYVHVRTIFSINLKLSLLFSMHALDWCDCWR